MLFLGLSLAGCVFLREPYSKADFNYNGDGQPVSYKRYERHPERDFFHHWFRTVYHRPSESELSDASADQEAVLQEWGDPEFIRAPFSSIEDQVIYEWVYTNKAHVFQFHRGHLVFEGPLTDYEQILMRRGYPDNARAFHTESAPRSDVFVYSNLFNPGLENYKFSEGNLVQSKEGD